MRGLSVIYLIVAMAVLPTPTVGQKTFDRVGNHQGLTIAKRFKCNATKKRMFTSDMSYTVHYKFGQVSQNTLHDHWDRIKAIHGFKIDERIQWHPVLFSGYQLPGNVKKETLDFVRSLPGVVSVRRSKLFRSHGKISWGLDRIDQKKLPLDGTYKPIYNGSGTNIFIVDSGIDTSHTEFNTVNREVRNVFDSYNSGDLQDILLNNDGVGHGTHVAGTIGGNTVGVSPGANLYGVRVLNSNGAGSDFDILSGLSFIYDWYFRNGRQPSVISMSLGGECVSYFDCEQDALVKAVEVLSDAGIVVVTAAGNSDCDSCLQTPAFAPHAITVGASSSIDEAAVFSDFGKCIDIYAPGVNITSACGSAMCDRFDKLVSLSGTSMATPHVSGVIAQMLQANPTATVQEITTMLSCNASPLVLDIRQDRPPAATRNLLLQIPFAAAELLQLKSDSDAAAVEGLATCDLGGGCKQFENCSGRGLCQEGQCLCDTLAWGSNCSFTEFGTHCDKGSEFIPYTLFNGGGDSWHGVELKISRVDVNGGYESTSGACLETGVVYKFEVSLPEDHFQPSSTLGATDTISRAIGQIGWSICGETGGVPANMNFKLLSPDDAAQSKRKCEIVCDTSIFEIELTSKAIIDSTGEIPHGLSVGWGGGYYSLYHESTGLMYAGGTLLAFQKPMTHRVCLPQSIFSVDPSASNIKSSSSGKVIVIFSDGSIWDGGTGDPSRMWSTCGVTQILTTDFSFFQATLEPFVGCQLLPPPLLHDKTVSRVIISDEALSPLRVGVFSTYSHSSGSSYNTSRWFGKEYVISSIEVEDRMIETAVSNGSISSLASAAQFAHPLKGLKEWVLRVKAKAAIVSPPASSSITPTLPFSHGLSESASFLFVPTLGFPTPSAQHTEADQPNFFNVALSTEQAVLPLLLHPELLSAISSLNKTSDASVSFNSDDDNGNLLSNVRAKEAAAVRSSMLFSTSSNLHSAVASEDKRTQERPFWMSCGVKGKMDEYYKFHRADTAIGCERSCLMLNSTGDKTDTKGKMKDSMLVDFETDMALAFFTKADDFGELEALRRLTSRNFICMGNKTSADDKQCFRIILGGGTNIVDPIWQFCSLSTVPVTAVVEFCVTDWTECTAKIIDQPKCASEDFPPALLPPGDTTPSAPEAETLIKSSGPLIGMYILLYDEKGNGWSEAEYLIIYVPVSLNNLLSSVVSPILQKSVRNTIRDVDDGVDSNTSSLPLGQILVKQGALAVGKQTGYASICVANGCYTADVTLGNEPEQIAWVLCGMIGSAGMNVVFGISDGRCTIYPTMTQCQLTHLYPFVTIIYWSLYGAAVAALLVMATLIGLFCRRQKVRVSESGGVRELHQSLLLDSRSPLHGSNINDVDSATTNRVDGNRSDLENGGIELATRPLTERVEGRVFNGDYSQVPIEGDE